MRYMQIAAKTLVVLLVPFYEISVLREEGRGVGKVVGVRFAC